MSSKKKNSLARRAALLGASILMSATAPSLAQAQYFPSSSTPTQAALGLYGAWFVGNYDLALQYASPTVVNQLFSAQSSRSWQFQGCFELNCSFSSPIGPVSMRVEPMLGSAQRNFRVTAINFSNVTHNTTPEDAALGLVRAWRVGNQAVAAQYGTPAAVNQMFQVRPGTNLEFQGCRGLDCYFQYSSGGVKLRVEGLLGSPIPSYRVTNVTIMNI